MTFEQRLVAIGAVAAGTSAAAKAKRVNPGLQVLLLERDEHISYSSCGLPYFLAGLVPRIEDLVARTAAEFARQGVEVRTNQEVLEIDAANRTLRVADLKTAMEYEVPYDRLVVATGATAIKPNVDGANLAGVFLLRTLSDGVVLHNALLRKLPRSVVIVGGGYVGLEMAETFHSLGLSVTIVEMAAQLMVNLDEEVSKLVLAEVQSRGVQVMLNDGLARCEGTDHVEKVVTQHSEMPADLVLMAVGVRPNTALAVKAGCRLGAGRAISVDRSLRTNIEGIYAAGDCADTEHQVTGQRTYIPLGSTANKQGRAAGANAAGTDQCTFEGVVGTALCKVFGLQVARTGLTEREAVASGFVVDTSFTEGNDRSSYYPGVTKLHVKLVVDRNTRRLLGAQMVGGDGVAKRIDVLAAALYAKLSVDDLTRLDYSYAPPFAPVWDPILVAASVVGPCR